MSINDLGLSTGVLGLGAFLGIWLGMAFASGAYWADKDAQESGLSMRTRSQKLSLLAQKAFAGMILLGGVMFWVSCMNSAGAELNNNAARRQERATCLRWQEVAVVHEPVSHLFTTTSAWVEKKVVCKKWSTGEIPICGDVLLVGRRDTCDPDNDSVIEPMSNIDVQLLLSQGKK